MSIIVPTIHLSQKVVQKGPPELGLEAQKVHVEVCVKTQDEVVVDTQVEVHIEAEVETHPQAVPPSVEVHIEVETQP